MGLIKEPEGVDFIIQSPPLTDKERKEISEFIRTRKLSKKELLKEQYQKSQLVHYPANENHIHQNMVSELPYQSVKKDEY